MLPFYKGSGIPPPWSPVPTLYGIHRGTRYLVVAIFAPLLSVASSCCRSNLRRLSISECLSEHDSSPSSHGTSCQLSLSCLWLETLMASPIRAVVPTFPLSRRSHVPFPPPFPRFLAIIHSA